MKAEKEDKKDSNTYRYLNVNYLKRVGSAVMLNLNGERHYLPVSVMQKLLDGERKASRMAVQTEEGNEETHYVNRDSNGLNINVNNKVRLHAWEEDIERLLDEEVGGINLYRRVNREDISYEDTDLWLNMSKSGKSVYFKDGEEELNIILPEVLEAVVYGDREGATFSIPEDGEYRETYYVQRVGKSLQIRINNRAHYVPVEPVKSMLFDQREKGVRMVRRSIRPR